MSIYSLSYESDEEEEEDELISGLRKWYKHH